MDTASQFITFFEREVGRQKLLITSEIDCQFRDEPKKSKSNYVELKCRKDVSVASKYKLKRHVLKYSRYWLQSHLVSVPTIVEGVRDSNGKLVQVNVLQTEKLPELCMQHRKDLQMGWNPTKILDFLSFMLTQIYRLCEENAGTTVRLKFDASEKSITSKLLTITTLN